MLNIYIHKRIEGLEHVHILNYYLGFKNFRAKRSGDDAVRLLNKQFFNLVNKPEMADYFLIPHNYFLIKRTEYIDEFINLSKKHNKKILVYSYGDSDEDIDVPNSIIFRYSQYAYKKKKNEIIMPVIADDLLKGEQIMTRKKSLKPVIGFCGWASIEGFSRRIIENTKLFLIFIKTTFLNKNYFFHRRGLIFRIDTIKALKKSNIISPNFIIRSSFSGNEKTRKGNFDDVRSDYIKNIINSDFSLSVKGDGNASERFYEILSLGRVPLFVDTDCVLPLEEIINYKDFVLKVDCREIHNIDKIVVDFYNNISEDEFILMQRKAREVYEQFLRIDKYFEYIFSDSGPLNTNK